MILSFVSFNALPATYFIIFCVSEIVAVYLSELIEVIEEHTASLPIVAAAYNEAAERQVHLSYSVYN